MLKNDLLWQNVSKYAESVFGIVLDQEAKSRLERYSELLIEWNSKLNLVSFKSDEELVWRHLFDSLAGLYALKKFIPEFDKSTKIIDLGTGAGLPGVPIKIACPNLGVTLAESVKKKCLFLEAVQKELGLDLEIINERTETLAHSMDFRESFNATVSRAFCKLSPNLENAVPFLKLEGYSFIHKSESVFTGEPSEIKPGINAAKILGAEFIEGLSYQLPNDTRDFYILVFKKISHTPEKYPRRTGVPQKKPLG
jgi:16S rRNA (guanine527-N7)-methyltransferase